ncbi:MAG: hypothetical protein D6696_09845, partial [Acidobacteria bacterium]
TGGARLDGARGFGRAIIPSSDGENSNGADSDSADSDGADGDSDSGDSDSADSDSADSDSGDSDSGDSDGADSDSAGDEPKAGLIKFDQRRFTVAEDAGVAVITVERSKGEDGEVSVAFHTFDGEAVAGSDYTAVDGILTWADGDGSAKIFAVPILDDDEAEGVETVVLELADVTGGAEVDPLRGSAVLRIEASDGGGDDGERSGVIKLAERAFQVLESGALAVVTVERSKGESGPATVSYATHPASAEEGVDYTAVSGTLSWDDQDGASKTILVPILDDDLTEGNENLTVELSDATGATLDRQRKASLLTIVDDDSTECVPNDATLCLHGGRFRVEVAWATAQGATGTGHPLALSDRAGLFWFFDPGNVELLIKILDGCRKFDSFWVFFSATTDLALEVTVTDTVAGVSKTYRNSMGQSARPVKDVTTFATCK